MDFFLENAFTNQNNIVNSQIIRDAKNTNNII